MQRGSPHQILATHGWPPYLIIHLSVSHNLSAQKRDASSYVNLHVPPVMNVRVATAQVLFATTTSLQHLHAPDPQMPGSIDTGSRNPMSSSVKPGTSTSTSNKRKGGEKQVTQGLKRPRMQYEDRAEDSEGEQDSQYGAAGLLAALVCRSLAPPAKPGEMNALPS